ncbi:C-type lectin domain family 4 member M-like isoform X2 [Archocentrus centrarchus]|uniref:C-type lectin domain family 4 member M-like isoform X2 n=1 Tax=Archocentrus centrarchus TaxID=63155 RepID=UPI0011E9DB24|nr:C-type lectin domain family 4 member M-like isoform X2 [Archocentrus centrarchus]
MKGHKDKSGIVLDVRNLNASARTAVLNNYTGESGEVAAALPGGKLLKWVAVSFCLVCILQAALNISLRLALRTDASCKNLTEEEDSLKKNNDASQNNILTRERDDLKRKLADFASQNNILTREIDDLKRKLADFVSQNNILTRERDDLKRKLEDFVHYAQQGWQYFNGSFYYISSTKQNWQDSRDDCLQRGASLAIINSKEEQKFIRQQQETIIWIGLTDKETEGVWKWVDETPLTGSFWYSGEPNNYRGSDEDCVVINYYNDENSWNDAVCENQNLWLCEKKMVI